MVSLVIQNREIREARKNARRAHHVELMRMAMDDPRYMECWGPYLTDSFPAETQYTYVNLIVAHWYSEYEVGELSDTLLRAMAVNVFASDPGHHYWEKTGTFGVTTTRANRHAVSTRCSRTRIRTRPGPPPHARPSPRHRPNLSSRRTMMSCRRTEPSWHRTGMSCHRAAPG